MKVLLSLQQIAQRTVEILQGNERDLDRSSSQLSYEHVCSAINSSYGTLSEKGKECERFELLTYQNATLNTTTRLLDIYWPGRRGNIMALTERAEQETTPTFAERWAEYHRVRDGEYVSPVRYRIVSGRIYVLEGAGGEYYRLWYFRQPTSLFQGTATAGTATTITVPTATYGYRDPMDDAYNGEIIRIVSGTGVGQQARVTDYNGTTGVFTCESVDSDSDPFAVTPSTDSVISIQPWFPDQYTETLAYLAAMQFKKIAISGAIAPEAIAKNAQFMAWAESDDLVTSDKVVNRGGVKTGMIGNRFGNSSSYGLPDLWTR